MRLPAIMLAVLLASASMWAQALIEYGGALSPAAKFAARPNNAVTRIHPKQGTASESRQAQPSVQSTRSQPTKVGSPRRTENGRLVREIHLSEQQASAAKNASERKSSIAAPGAITIQR